MKALRGFIYRCIHMYVHSYLFPTDIRDALQSHCTKAPLHVDIYFYVYEDINKSCIGSVCTHDIHHNIVSIHQTVYQAASS